MSAARPYSPERRRADAGTAVQQGPQHLKDVLAGKTPAATPSLSR
ncbi:hypothetical protein [Streptomyces sp. NPDC054834]